MNPRFNLHPPEKKADRSLLKAIDTIAREIAQRKDEWLKTQMLRFAPPAIQNAIERQWLDRVHKWLVAEGFTVEEKQGQTVLMRHDVILSVFKVQRDQETGKLSIFIYNEP